MTHSSGWACEKIMNIDPCSHASRWSFKWMLSVSAVIITDNAAQGLALACIYTWQGFFLGLYSNGPGDNEVQMGTTELQTGNKATVSAALLVCFLSCYLQTERGRTRFPFSASYTYKCGHMWHLHEDSIHVRSRGHSWLGQQWESLSPSAFCLGFVSLPSDANTFPSTNTRADTCVALLMRRCALFSWMTPCPLWQHEPSWVCAASQQLHTAASSPHSTASFTAV